MDYEPVIGLEVHVQLATKTKLFCGCRTTFGAPPNSQTCPVCLGFPGVLPVLNKEVVELAILSAIALNCTINPYSRFSRKNYFYPDLPKAYQISQYDLPLAKDGWVEISSGGKIRKIGIIRVHLEEDAGKLIHEDSGSLVDYNRCGIPLIEIVSSPMLRSSQEAYEYLNALKDILRYLRVSDCNMEEGSLRCDANVSVREKDAEGFGTKTEVKNMNSFKAVKQALDYEISRQIDLLEKGRRVLQETRLWDERESRTHGMRTKEEAHDYRYFPEPDLVPLSINPEWVNKISKRLPELPKDRMNRFLKEYGLPEYDALVLTSSRDLADYYEECVRLYNQPKVISNWIMTELLALLKEDGIEITQVKIKPEHLISMLGLIDKGVISGKIAKDIIVHMFRTGKDPSLIVEEKGLVQITDEDEVSKVIDEVILENKKAVLEYKSGKTKVMGFLVGQVMKKTEGKANPQIVNKLLREKI
ncbi:MAG: Asp-tRNA(Asn)/Glu-tRNA(Gln) amidotransferase subunit GatB [bacterium]|nr:Asp-tRNA(Asn)/Glu-tRNA(Gln) amidotransferase subunit GatB [bacterium]